MKKSGEHYYKIIQERDGNEVVFAIDKNLEASPNQLRILDIELKRWRTQSDLVAWLRQCADAVEGMSYTTGPNS